MKQQLPFSNPSKPMPLIPSFFVFDFQRKTLLYPSSLSDFEATISSIIWFRAWFSKKHSPSLNFRKWRIEAHQVYSTRFFLWFFRYSIAAFILSVLWIRTSISVKAVEISHPWTRFYRNRGGLSEIWSCWLNIKSKPKNQTLNLNSRFLLLQTEGNPSWFFFLCFSLP